MNVQTGPPRAVSALGFWAAFGTALTTLITFAIAVFTPPISGQFCREDCIEYPYSDIAARFPRDYYWMFTAIVSTLLYVALMIALQARASKERRPLVTCAVGLAIMTALLPVGVYYVQLAVLEPRARAAVEADSEMTRFWFGQQRRSVAGGRVVHPSRLFGSRRPHDVALWTRREGK